MSQHKKAREETHVIFTPTALVVSLGEEHQRQAQACLERSGEIKFSLKEVAVSELPSIRSGLSNLVTED
jgi:hypothetical protein